MSLIYYDIANIVVLLVNGVLRCNQLVPILDAFSRIGSYLFFGVSLRLHGIQNYGFYYHSKKKKNCGFCVFFFFGAFLASSLSVINCSWWLGLKSSIIQCSLLQP